MPANDLFHINRSESVHGCTPVFTCSVQGFSLTLPAIQFTTRETTMDGFLLAIEESALGVYIREDAWGFAIALSVHAVGMAMALGVVMLVNFRILGVLKQVPVLAHSALFGTAWLGFIINLLSGIALYSSHATEYTYQSVFILKITLLAIGGYLMKLTMEAVEAKADEARIRLYSFVTISCWIGAVITGRLMAYF
jgi:hypothetical protein